MVSPDGRHVLVYNGEVYNYRQIAAALGDDPVAASSPGDTAVVLAALIRWGPAALERFNGMWALALFDRQSNRLLLSRDRMGVKPLYWHQDGPQLVAASEVKSIVQVCGRMPVNTEAVRAYLGQGLTDFGPATFFEGIEAFPAGCYAEIDLSRHRPDRPQPIRYWRHPFETEQAAGGAGAIGAQPSAEEVRETFVDAVRLRLRSDVPVGILLSGGVDSSSILAAARLKGEGGDLTALTVVSDDPVADERAGASLMAERVGVPLLQVNVDQRPTQLLEGLSDACWYNDQPFTTLSVVAHRMVMEQAARLGITVLLTGQGADEQLGGYNKFLYFYLYHSLRDLQWREGASMLVGCARQRTVLPEFRLSEAKRYLGRLGRRGQPRPFGPAILDGPGIPVGPGSSYAYREWRDMTSLSVPALLHYEDRMSMSWSREMRSPFMDYRLVELLARVSPGKKLERGWTKAIFRQAMEGLLPAEIQWQRRKRGFTIPEQAWIRSVMRQPIQETLGRRDSLSVQLGLVDPAVATTLLQRYFDRSGAVGYKDVFTLFCLEVWLQRFAPYIRGASAS